uniref:Uncharacterized protein n=1 Tax=Caenorhabditis japonica TaxID=281687 RepID=A0A8R1ISJ1_CAEJA
MVCVTRLNSRVSKFPPASKRLFTSETGSHVPLVFPKDEPPSHDSPVSYSSQNPSPSRVRNGVSRLGSRVPEFSGAINTFSSFEDVSSSRRFPKAEPLSPPSPDRLVDHNPSPSKIRPGINRHSSRVSGFPHASINFSSAESRYNVSPSTSFSKAETPSKYPIRYAAHSPSPSKIRRADPLFSPSNYAAPRNAPTTPPDSSLYMKKDIIVRESRLSLTELEYTFFESIDPNRHVVENMKDSVEDNVMDIGIAGLVLLRHQLADTMTVQGYEDALLAFSHNPVSALGTVSILDELTPKVFQLGQTFFSNIYTRRLMEINKKESKAAIFSTNPTFQYVEFEFNGNFPFRPACLVSLRSSGKVPSGTLNAMGWVVRNVLAIILDDPRGHQNMCIRAIAQKNVKNYEWIDCPEEVIDFILGFCLESFGFPRAIRYDGYSFEQFSLDNPRLAANEDFDTIRKDADKFNSLVFDKLQRTFYDLRKFEVKETPLGAGGIRRKFVKKVEEDGTAMDRNVNELDVQRNYIDSPLPIAEY